MIEFQVTTLDHIKEIYKNLRKEDKKEITRLGFDPDKALYYSFKHALIKRTCLIDGKVAAVWGVVGTPLGLVGQPYLMTSPLSLKISSIKFARIYKRELDGMKKVFPILENYVDAQYLGACRLLKISGFTLDENNPFKTKNGDMFYKFTLSTT